MNRRLIFAGTACLSLWLGVACKNDSIIEGDTYRSHSQIGGGPIIEEEKVEYGTPDSGKLDKNVKAGEVNQPNGASIADPVHGPESLAGGGSKTANGATGKSMLEAAPDAGKDAK